MGPFDRPYTTVYWSAIVNIALSACYRFFSYLALNDIMTLKSGLEVTQGHLKWHHLKAWVRFHSPSIVAMALYCISSEMKPDIGRKS